MGEDVGKRFFGQRAEPQRGEGDAELAGRQHPAEICYATKREPGESVAAACHGFESRAPGTDQRELNCYEIAVQEQQNDDGDYAAEHQPKL